MLDLEIILVENGISLTSSDLPQESLAPQRPMHRIHNAVNRGVARARNQGLKAAAGEFLMLLDVDTEVGEEALVNLVQFMRANPQVGLAGPRLQDETGKLQLSCRRLPTLWGKILRRVAFEWARRMLADELLADWDHSTARDVDWVIGACQIIRRSAYEQVGPLDEGFFYGPEDVDYCIRMWRAGWRVSYVPQAIVTHLEQRLTRRRPWSRLALVHAWGVARYFGKYGYLQARPALRPFEYDAR